MAFFVVGVFVSVFPGLGIVSATLPPTVLQVLSTSPNLSLKRMRPRVCMKHQQTGISLTDITKTQQQRPEWPAATPTWLASKYKVLELHQVHIHFTQFEFDDVLWGEFTYLVFTCLPLRVTVGDSGFFCGVHWMFFEG